MIDLSSTYNEYRYLFTYDSRNQLLSAIYNYHDGSAWVNVNIFDVTGISYDMDGNLAALNRRHDGLKEYVYSYAAGSNRVSGITKNGVNTAFGYDRNGNVTILGSGYNITATTYNWRNLPLSITAGGNTHSYKYDHTGSRVHKSSGNTFYVRGAFGETLAVYSGSTVQYWNLFTPAGTVIGRREGANRFYYHRDHLGSTRTVVNASGTVVETQDYYPYGLQMPGRSLTTGNSAREKFTSHELDSEVDLYYMVARRYAPEFGRFLSVDPLADEYPDWSPYNYTLNNPVRYTDPTGMFPEEFESYQVSCSHSQAANKFSEEKREDLFHNCFTVENKKAVKHS